MKKFSVLLITFYITIIFLSIANAVNDTSGWKFYKNIIDSGSNKYKAVYLDDEVYKFCNPVLSDLRIADNTGKNVSYYIQNYFTVQSQSNNTYKSNISNKFKEKNTSVYDYAILPIKDDADILGSTLVFGVDSDKFLKNVEIYGSYDNIDWQYILKDTIYKIDNIQKLDIQFDKIYKYRFYRVKVLNDIENSGLLNLTLLDNNVKYCEESYTNKTKLEYNIKTENQYTLINLKNPNKLRLKNLHLNIEENFRRNYQLSIKNDSTSVTDKQAGELYNLNFQDIKVKNTDINVEDTSLTSEEIQIRIFNHDDNPLKINSIDTSYYVDKLVFEAVQGNTYRLLFGNTAAQMPSYDMETFKEHIEKESQDTLALSKMFDNPESKVEKKNTLIPETYIKPLFNALIILLSIVLILIIYRKLKFRNDEG